MEAYLKLTIVAILPILVSALVYLLEKKEHFQRLKYMTRQAIIGIMFGILAIFGTECAVTINGIVISTRDAAPLCAGLIFGGPAGIIAGIIGGVERGLAVYWGADVYSQTTCVISTILAGFYAALLRKYMFDDKKPHWSLSLAIGVVMEVLQFTILFLTNLDDVHTAFEVIRDSAAVMAIFNGMTVMLSVLFVSLIGKERIHTMMESKRIAQTIQRRLLFCVLIAFLATTYFMYMLQASLSERNVNDLLTLNLNDVYQDILEASDANMLQLTHTVAAEIEQETPSNTSVRKIAEQYHVAEINLIDENGVITASTNETFCGYAMDTGEQSGAFLVLLGDATEYVQDYQQISYDSSIYRKYAGVSLKQGGFVQVGYDAENFQHDISEQVVGATRNRHVGESGCVIICDENGKIVSDRNHYEGRPLADTGLVIEKELPAGTRFEATVYGEECYCIHSYAEGYTIIAVMPVEEAVFSRDLAVCVSMFMEIIVFAVLFALIYFLIKGLVVDNIRKVNESLGEITNGNLNITVDVRSNEEFASLSDDINSTVTTLKSYITEAAARIDKELEFAKTIQHAALPNIPVGDYKDGQVDLYATMFTAKEVGGDFYDFYPIGEHKFAFLIADVSGKGIPAAMFMMTAKTMLKSLAETDLDVNEVFTNANRKLCESNDAGMFVTAWMGVIDLQTGLVTYANAGHNYPLLRQDNGEFEYLKSRAGFVLAGMDSIQYRINEMYLKPGDIIYLYTDGVTEATNAQDELYGDDRLLETLNRNREMPMEALCKAVKADVDQFVGEAPQFDDITMLAIRLKEI